MPHPLNRRIAIGIVVLTIGCGRSHVSSNPQRVDFGAELVGTSETMGTVVIVSPNVTFTGVCTIAGPDERNFEDYSNCFPNERWETERLASQSFKFLPDRRGVFNATYTIHMAEGTSDVIELTGIGATDVERGTLSHALSLPDGIDFGNNVCIGTRKDIPFEVRNGGKRDTVIVIGVRGSPAFSIVETDVQRVVRRNGGTTTWTIRFEPIFAAQSTGAVMAEQVRRHGNRTGVTVKGQGKHC
jgi:hypothetical protein